MEKLSFQKVIPEYFVGAFLYSFLEKIIAIELELFNLVCNFLAQGNWIIGWSTLYSVVYRAWQKTTFFLFYSAEIVWLRILCFKIKVLLFCFIISVECLTNFEFDTTFSIVDYALNWLWFVFDLVWYIHQ